MFYKNLNEEELKLIEEIVKITDVDYELKGNFIPTDNLLIALKDMLWEYHNKEEELKGKIDDLEYDLENNYELKRFDPYEEYGVSPKDFC